MTEDKIEEVSTVNSNDSFLTRFISGETAI